MGLGFDIGEWVIVRSGRLARTDELRWIPSCP
jgi:hypothetical protein